MLAHRWVHTSANTENRVWVGGPSNCVHTAKRMSLYVAKATSECGQRDSITMHLRDTFDRVHTWILSWPLVTWSTRTHFNSRCEQGPLVFAFWVKSYLVTHRPYSTLRSTDLKDQDFFFSPRTECSQLSIWFFMRITRTVCFQRAAQINTFNTSFQKRNRIYQEAWHSSR